MTKLVKILLNGKVSSVYPEEASVLLAKGLAKEYFEQKEYQSNYENKMIDEPKKNKGRKKNAIN